MERLFLFHKYVYSAHKVPFKIGPEHLIKRNETQKQMLREYLKSKFVILETSKSTLEWANVSLAYSRDKNDCLCKMYWRSVGWLKNSHESNKAYFLFHNVWIIQYNIDAIKPESSFLSTLYPLFTQPTTNFVHKTIVYWSLYVRHWARNYFIFFISFYAICGFIFILQWKFIRKR